MSYSIFADPIDTLFFRDGSPFNAGESPYLESIFPPSPHTGFGFSRAVVLILMCKNLDTYIKGGCNGCEFQEDCPITDAVGDPSKRDGTLSVKGLYLFGEERFFPAPRDLVVEKDVSSPKEATPAYVPNTPVQSDLGHVRLPSAKEGSQFLDDVGDHLVPESVLGRYLQNEPIDYSQLKRLRNDESEKKPMIYGEGRTGIAVNESTGASLEKHLYSIEMIRLRKGMQLWSGISGLKKGIDLPTKTTTARLGGESKRVRVNLAEGLDLAEPSITDEIASSGRLKIMLLQHADFDGQWYPPCMTRKEGDENVSWDGEVNGVQMTLVSAMTGKPVYFGGWDTAKGRPRPLEP
ncbi:MAG: hypothetical protein GF309_01515, partial [Candidatus Lokiarchaeota archaeon]|nr:hypothetical protein [Candidatus Lokiarchaeota archaeon]